MEEFLRQNYSLLTRSVEILAAVTGMIFFKKYKPTAAKYFIYFLIYVVIIEIIGSYPRYIANYNFLEGFKTILKDSWAEKNYWFYTVFWMIGSALFFSYYYQKVLKNKQFITVIKYANLSFLILSVACIVYKWDFFNNTFFPIIAISSGLLILLSTIFYFIEILISENILTFNKSINFYISIALFIWVLITTPLVFYDVYNSSNDWNFVILKWQIRLFANIFLYTTFTIGLLVSKPEKI